MAVDLEELAERMAEYGPVAFVVTVGERGPHVVSTRVVLDDHGSLVAGAGRTTAANAAERPRLTVQWPPVASRPEYCLLVDGDATVDHSGDQAVLRIRPDRAVLHRLADAPGDGPSCITVLDAR